MGCKTKKRRKKVQGKGKTSVQIREKYATLLRFKLTGISSASVQDGEIRKLNVQGPKRVREKQEGKNRRPTFRRFI
jgi:hypothetical protein